MPVTVMCHTGVAEVINRSAATAAPRETGGLLLGWWEPGAVVVQHAIEVVDPAATESSWCRSEETAQQALARALDQLDQLWLGYVGDWHNHPKPCLPSNTDLASISRASRQFAEPLALLVHTPGDILDVRAAHRGRPRPARLQCLDPEKTR
jgi:proteasome lid subunit RPN8/RPN11